MKQAIMCASRPNQPSPSSKRVGTFWKISKTLICVSSISWPLSVNAAPDAAALVKKAEAAQRGNNSYSRVSMRIEKRRIRRTMAMEVWDDRVGDRYFLRITAPKKDRGTTFLKKENNLWQYIPKIGKELRIESSLLQSSWMGSDFSNDDLMRQSTLSEDYHHEQTENGTSDYYEIESRPRPGVPVNWQKIISRIDRATGLFTRHDFYDHRGRLSKTMLLDNFKTMRGRLIPARMIMQTMRSGRPISRTIIETMEIRFNTNIPSYVFSKANLRRK